MDLQDVPEKSLLQIHLWLFRSRGWGLRAGSAMTLDPAHSPHPQSCFDTWTILRQTFFWDTLYTYKSVDNHIPLGLTNWKCQVCSHGRRREGIFGMLLIWQITYLLSFHHKFWDGGQNNPKIGNFMLRRGGASVLCRAGPYGFNPCRLSSWEQEGSLKVRFLQLSTALGKGNCVDHGSPTCYESYMKELDKESVPKNNH